MRARYEFVIALSVACIISGCSTPNSNQGEEVVVTKVPLLGDIPILGALFRHAEVHPKKQAPLSAGSQTLISTNTESVTISARLTKLKNLRDSGAITEAEYQARRKELVEKL